MKISCFKNVTACMLLLAVLCLVGTTTAASVTHDVQHAGHHTAASHSSGICAWMCATGGMVHQAWPMIQSIAAETPYSAAPSPHHPSGRPINRLTSRAPPAFFV
jgi:hypothetical protein